MQYRDLRGLHAYRQFHANTLAIRPYQQQATGFRTHGPKAQPRVIWQVLRGLRPSPFCQVGWRRTKLHRKGAQAPGHEAGIRQCAHAQGNIDTLAEHISHRVIHQQREAQFGVLAQGRQGLCNQPAQANGGSDTQLAIWFVPVPR